jgi:AhpD family alkylhydroperoxidase
MTLSSQLNGCSFCADLHLAQAVQEKLGLDEFQALGELTWLNALGNFFNLIAIPLGVKNDGLMQRALERRAA